jgi:hypothetical protein
MRRESLGCLQERYGMATIDCKQRWLRHDSSKPAFGKRADGAPRSAADGRRRAPWRWTGGAVYAVGAGNVGAGDQRPSGVRTPIQLSRTWW